MDLPETSTHSFVIKIWLEETVAESGVGIWRGRITHVPDGENMLVTQMNDIPNFVAPYLETLGELPRARGQWLNHWRRCRLW